MDQTNYTKTNDMIQIKSQHIKGIYLIILPLMAILFSFSANAQNSSFLSENNNINEAISLHYRSLFHLNEYKNEGIVGAIRGSGRIDVYAYDYDPKADQNRGEEIYHVWIDKTAVNPEKEATPLVKFFIAQSTSKFVSVAASDDIKKRAQSATGISADGRVCKTWVDSIKSVFVGRSEACDPVESLPIIVEVRTSGSVTFDYAKIPGVGHVIVKNGKVVLSDFVDNVLARCDLNSANGSVSSELCDLYKKMRTANTSASEDLIIAAHRGWWGYNLGDSPAENSLDAVSSANRAGAKIIEMDITESADRKLLFMHDYVMKRLTNYTGDKFSFELPWNEIQNYKIKKRNKEVTDLRLSRYAEVLNYVKSNNMIMMADIKELQSNGAGANCLANCDFQSFEKKQQSWKAIARRIIEEARALDAQHHIIIKVYYSYPDVRRLLGELSDYVLWTPMIVPNNFKGPDGKPDINLMTQFIDEWNRDKARNHVANFETNFFGPDDIQLKEFSKRGTVYPNLLDYVNRTTGRRSGVFSEEPVDPRGSVNRWGKWSMKNPSKDIRGDFFRLLSIPGGNTMVITSDRLDIWKEIKNKF